MKVSSVDCMLSPDLTRKVRQRVARVRSCFEPSRHGWFVAQTLCKDFPFASSSKEKRPMRAGHGGLLCTQSSFNGTSLVSCGLPPGFPLFQMRLAQWKEWATQQRSGEMDLPGKGERGYLAHSRAVKGPWGWTVTGCPPADPSGSPQDMSQ